MEERVKQAEAIRKVHQKFQQLVEEKNMHSKRLQIDTIDSNHKPLIVFHDYEMNDLKWGMLMRQYPAMQEDIFEFTNTFKLYFVFDYLGIYENLFAFGMQVRLVIKTVSKYHYYLFHLK